MDFKVTTLLLAFALIGTYECVPTVFELHDDTHVDTGDVKRLGIYGGGATTIERHPYLVSILATDYYAETNDYYFIGAGTIVSDSWVVTSGFCADSMVPEALIIMAASNDAYTGDQYAVTDVVFHPQYDPATLDYNYALIRIVGSFSFQSKVKAVVLPDIKLPVDEKVMASGWGGTGSNAKDNGLTLLQGTMRWQDPSFCNSSLSTVLDIQWTDRMACAYNKGKTTLCGNDVGDPFIHKGVLYGVFVLPSENSCSSSAGPVLIADILTVKDWIVETTGAGAIAL